jgi:excisionase family DNA binding protein
MNQLLYSINDCCRLASVGRTKLYELIANGEIPVRKIGRKTLIAAPDLLDWIERLPATKANSRGHNAGREAR